MSLVLDVKIKDSKTKVLEYRNFVELYDYKKFAILLKDLEMYGVPVKKAYEALQTQTNKPTEETTLTRRK